MSDLDKDIEILKELVNDVFKAEDDEVIEMDCYRAGAITRTLKELETYKKIAERLAKRIDKLDEENYNYCQSGETHCKETNRCIQCIIDWARKEVEK